MKYPLFEFMKTILLLLSFAIFSSFANAAAPAVGSVSENQGFALHSGATFSSTSLNDYEGKILVLMMMTPWCPICQSHAQSVGSGLLEHFNNPSRGSLRGKNNHGVPIQSVLLSTEEAASWDSVNLSFSNTHGFDRWGLDANTQRQNPRELLGYFRGGFINSSNLYNWGNDRRRVVVLNLVKGSASHSFREIVINQNSYSSDDHTAARAAINRILAQEESTALPLIELEQGSTPLKNGISTISFGQVLPKGSTTLAFTIRNTSGGELTGITASLTGGQVADYQVSSLTSTTVAPNQTASFSITFTPLAVGTQTAMLHLTSTAGNLSLFSVNLTGASVLPSPEIEVQQPRQSILKDGKTKRSFGTTKVRSKGRSLTFRISNAGDAVLHNLSLAKKGNHPNDFIIGSPGRTQLDPGMSTIFEVTFMPRGAGTRKATLKLNSNDADESQFDIPVTGFGTR